MTMHGSAAPTTARGDLTSPAQGAGSPEVSCPADDIAARRRRELESLAKHVHTQHPDIPMDTVVSMLEREYRDLEQSRIQAFRVIFAERAVRRRLTAATGQASPCLPRLPPASSIRTTTPETHCP